MGSKCAFLTVTWVVFFVALTLPFEGRARELGDTFRNFEPALPTLPLDRTTKELAHTFNAGEPLFLSVKLWLHPSLFLSDNLGYN